MVATGRVPNTKTLGLENMGIETNRGFVQVTRHLEEHLVRKLVCTRTRECHVMLAGPPFSIAVPLDP